MRRMDGLLPTPSAKSVGKSMLLSDLNVHKEQNPPNSQFFSVHDPNDLARKLEDMWNRTKPGPDSEMESLASAKQAERMKAFSQKFVEICIEAKTLAK